jgi:hypothetical protein
MGPVGAVNDSRCVWGGLLQGPGARRGVTAQVLMIRTVLKVADMRRPIETNAVYFFGVGGCIKKSALVKVKRSCITDALHNS